MFWRPRQPASLNTHAGDGVVLLGGYEEVMRSLTEGLAWASDGREEYELPSQVAISKARTRLGPEPLAELFTLACVPPPTPATPGAF